MLIHNEKFNLVKLYSFFILSKILLTIIIFKLLLLLFIFNKKKEKEINYAFTEMLISIFFLNIY